MTNLDITIHVVLNSGNGFPWSKKRNGAITAWVRGSAFNRGAYLSSDELATLTISVMNRTSDQQMYHSFAEMLMGLNGCFAIVVQMPDHILAAVDRIRSFPLFYGFKDGVFYLSDNAAWMRERTDDQSPAWPSVREFMLTGYVTGSATLFSEVRQLQAGEYLCQPTQNSLSQTILKRYYKWVHGNYYDATEEELCAEMDRMHIRVFCRLLDSTKDKTIVLPLSGGFDSRFIAVMLKRLGRENVICFSYGRPGNWESNVSKMVAERLGYRWEFISQSLLKWRTWYQSQERLAYDRYACNLTSRACYQDWPVVWELKEKGRIPNDAVIIPGHTGDFISGGHIPQFNTSKRPILGKDLQQQIWKKHYSIWTSNFDRWHHEFGGKQWGLYVENESISNEEAASAFEQWEWQERQAKYIINSVRAYEFWGYEWRLPLWDNDVMEYWARIPLRFRMGKTLYNRYVQSLFAEYGVASLKNANYSKQRLSFWSKQARPSLLRHRVVDYVRCMISYKRQFGGCILSAIKKLVNPLPMGVYEVLKGLDIDILHYESEHINGKSSLENEI